MSDPSAHNFSGSNSPAQKQFSPTRLDALATLALKTSTGQGVQATCDAFAGVDPKPRVLRDITAGAPASTAGWV